MRLPELLAAVRRPLRACDIGDPELIDYANEMLRLAASRVFLPDLEETATITVPAGATSVALPGDYQRDLFAVKNGDGVPLVVSTSAKIKGLRLGCPPPGAVRVVAAAGSTLHLWPEADAEETLVLGYFRLPRTLEQVAGSVTFSAATKGLSATAPLFARFHAGDLFNTDSALNAGAYTVAEADETTCTVEEAVADETATNVNIAATEIEGIPRELRRNVLVNGMLTMAFETIEDAVEGKPNTDRYRALYEAGIKELKRAIVATGYIAPTGRSSELHFQALA